MTVKDLIERLEEYNPDAEIRVVAHCLPHDFSLAYGSSEGVTKETAESVSLYVDSLCTNETQL